MHLFIDTTEKITFGLLSEDFKWLEYFFDPKIVISTKLHSLIQKMLDKNGIDFSQLDSLVYIAGPGSYTGMRVAEGIAQIVEWQNKSVFSFYHYEVPKICGVETGAWIASAFKGEMFLHEWDQKLEENKLLLTNDLENMVDGKNLFSLRGDLELKTTSTAQMIELNSQVIFNYVFKNKMKRKLYYYRPLEQEFSKC